MGGRKGYSAKRVIGDARSFLKEKKRFEEALKEEKPEKIVQTTLEIFNKSDTAIDNLSKGLAMFGFFEDSKKREKTAKEVKKEATKYWTKVKEDKKITAISEIDRLIVESATKTLRRRLKK